MFASPVAPKRVSTIKMYPVGMLPSTMKCAIGIFSVRTRRTPPQPRNHPMLDASSAADLARAFSARLVSVMEREGYFPRIRFDLDAWADRMRAAPNIASVNPTFDPACSDQGSSFWVDVTDRG